MSRRAACSVAAVAVAVLVGLLFVVPANYVVLGPGPSCNTVGNGAARCPSTVGDGRGPLITVPAADDHPSSSTLAFMTVSQDDGRPSIGQALFDSVRPGHAVVPREEIYPPGTSTGQVSQQDRSDMVQAQDVAVVAAEGILGLDRTTVEKVDAGPAAGVLQQGDELLTVDGQAVTSAAGFVALTQGDSTTTTYAVGIDRGGVRSTVDLHKARTGKQVLFGIGVTDVPTIPVSITLDPNAIGGPSAGMMFALGVYDRLTPGNLTGGVVVAGTGQLSDDAGDVIPIGGIQQKLYAAAHDVHATLFLAPQGNCSDTVGAVPKGLRVVPVSTLRQALSVLAQVREGDTADLPHC